MRTFSAKGELKRVFTAASFLGLSDTPSSYSSQTLKIPRVNAGETALEFATLAAILAGSHNLLDGSVHGDSVADAVSRGSLIYGNSTPKWDELVIGAANAVLTSDGTDAAWALPGMVLLEAESASSSATIDLTSFAGSTYGHYMISLGGITPATDDTPLLMRTSTDGGATFDSAASSYDYAAKRVLADGTEALATGVDTTFMILGSSQGNVSTERLSGLVWVHRPDQASRCRITWLVCYASAATLFNVAVGGGTRKAAADVDAVQFLFSSGNITSGLFKLYGIKA